MPPPPPSCNHDQPSHQLLPADCLAARVVELDKEMRAFFWMASFSYAGMVLLGFTSFFVDPFLVLKIGDVVCVSGATVNVSSDDATRVVMRSL